MHSLFPQMQVTIFSLGLLKTFNCYKYQCARCYFRYQLYSFIAFFNPASAAFHVATDVIFSPFSSSFRKHAATMTPYSKSIHSTTGFCLLSTFTHFAFVSPHKFHVSWSLPDVTERGTRLIFYIESSWLYITNKSFPSA